MTSPSEMASQIAASARMKRLALNWSQQTLSARSGVSYSVIKQFERTGKIALLSLIKIALALDALEAFQRLFQEDTSDQMARQSLDTLIKHASDTHQRQRGRQ